MIWCIMCHIDIYIYYVYIYRYMYIYKYMYHIVKIAVAFCATKPRKKVTKANSFNSHLGITNKNPGIKSAAGIPLSECCFRKWNWCNSQNCGLLPDGCHMTPFVFPRKDFQTWQMIDHLGGWVLPLLASKDLFFLYKDKPTNRLLNR